MSYSFTARAATKSLAMQSVTEQMTKVAEQQTVHAKDKDAVLATAEAFVGMLVGDDSQDVEVRVSGSLGWRENQEQITASNVSVSVYLVSRKG